MVSLIDTSNQIILAEATRSFDDSELWLGSTVLSRPMAVCEHCFVNTASSRTSPDGQSYSCRGLIVDDCRLDCRFKEREYVVQEESGVRFYAGVPIISSNGIMIGAYAVSHDQPRDGLSKDELRFMQETAATIMEHFEWARDRVDRFKGERIVRGMASFIETFSNPEAPPVTDAQDHAPVTANTDRPTARPALTPRKSYTKTRRSLDQSVKKSRSRSRPRGDSITRMYQQAAATMRDSALADGAAIFGAASTSAFPSALNEDAYGPPGGVAGVSSGSDGPAYDTSDSDTTPKLRPCKVLALSLADEQARDSIEQGSPLTLATLERYFNLYPQGRTFSFTEHGKGVSSDDESASDREPLRESRTEADGDEERAATRRKRKAQRMDHRELLKKIPGATSVIFLPLYDHTEERLVAGCFLWTSVAGRMMTYDDELSYLRAFGNSIMGEVMRINTQKNEAAKTTFIASMSHELRSPLHGILGAAEFLRDTAHDSFQSALISGIGTCGKTLLETLNHVLDYSKINRLGKHAMRRNAKQNKLVNLPSDSNLESLNMTAEIDLAVLVEEVVEAVTAGHAFKKLPASAVTAVTESSKTGKAADYNFTDALTTGSELASPTATVEPPSVSVLLDINPRQAWMVRTQPGALRRIIMNLIGNSLKYTSRGFVAVSLRAAEKPNSTKIETLIRVVDSGKGMSEDFQHEKLFLPFSQEDTFQPGTGLGLSIVKQIVDSLGGTIEVRSQPCHGTEIDVQLNLIAGDERAKSTPDDIAETSKRTQGLSLVLDPSTSHGRRSPKNSFARLEETLRAVCSNWFGLEVLRTGAANGSAADLCLYSKPPSLDELLGQNEKLRETSTRKEPIPIIIICGTAEEAIEVSRNQGKSLNDRGGMVQVIPQPCGPRKLSKVLRMCLDQVAERRESNKNTTNLGRKDNTGESQPENKARSHTAVDITRDQIDQAKTAGQTSPTSTKLSSTVSAALSFPSPPPLDPETPSLLSPREPPSKAVEKTSPEAILSDGRLHVLVVDDNKINLQLLVMFMKKHKLSYSEAENGKEALDKFKEACLPGPHSNAPSRAFDVCLMDISMPVMNGMEATKRIREFEAENGLSRTTVIALTGLASALAQKEAHLAGIDVFLPKPVKFAELKKLLDQKM